MKKSPNRTAVFQTIMTPKGIIQIPVNRMARREAMSNIRKGKPGYILPTAQASATSG